MRTTLLCITVLLGLTATAQNFQWQWAKRGGGIKHTPAESESAMNFESEQIIDIVVDANNNYYFLAFMGQGQTEYDGAPITVYNHENSDYSPTDVVLIATDCEGTLRWMQTIGGADRDFSYKIVLDNNGGLYLGASVVNISDASNPYLPPYFSPTDSMPVLGDNNGEAQPGYKTIALLKYNTSDGSLAWRVMPQGDVNYLLRYANINEVVIDSQGILHTLIGFRAGTHLNGQVTVPGGFTNQFKYYIVKYDRDGNLLSVLPLSLEGALNQFSTDFRYDENLGRYYLAGFRNYGGAVDPLVNLSFNGQPFTKQAYILAFGASGNEVWRKEITCTSPFQDSRFLDFEIDGDSNLYFAGKYVIDSESPSVNMNGYQFPSDLGGNIVYLMKLNAAGEVQWFSKPSGYTTSTGIFTGSNFAHDLVINGDEIGVATQVTNEIWGDFVVNRPVNHRSDPAILRLDKATGTPIGLHDIMGIANHDDAFTAITVDNDGNYITGGYFHSDLFTAPNDNVPTLTKVFDQSYYTDFFISKLAAGPCGSLATQDFTDNPIGVYPNPSDDVVYVKSNQELSGYQVSNLLGQVVLKGHFEQGEHAIPVLSLQSGTYIVRLKTIDGTILNHKIVKK
ncbi:T9SS type A sorting domain-containing protein [Flavobacterium sp.]|uniref:T9SS type A sorting domain-containing protein n=1 Tax=Flavobacterium sp. TaxID=239 RepID=UPI0039E28B3D